MPYSGGVELLLHRWRVLHSEIIDRYDLIAGLDSRFGALSSSCHTIGHKATAALDPPDAIVGLRPLFFLLEIEGRKNDRGDRQQE
jgi:hypothetical protein